MVDDAEDRLSSLPDDLLHQILSLLPSTNLVFQTSVLSKRWRHLWAQHPNLRFSMPDPSEAAASEVESIVKSYVLSVDRCLRSFEPPSLDSFEIDLWLPIGCSRVESKSNSKVADRWLRFAGLRSVRKLSVQVRPGHGFWCRLIPCSIFACRSVVDLSVTFGSFPLVSRRFLGFPNLTKIVLDCAFIYNWEVSHLLQSCPLLEYLELTKCVGLKRLEISARASPNLKHLVLVNSYRINKYFAEWTEVRIESPNLRSIIFKGCVSDQDWEGPLLLNEAEVHHKSKKHFESFNNWMKAVRAVSNASILRVDHWFYQFAIPKNWSSEPLFKNLTELHCMIICFTKDVLDSLTCSLRECPLLEKFMIDLDIDERSCAMYDEDPEEYDWNPFEHAGELDYYLHHLKTITVTNFTETKNEVQLFEFLLAKSIALEQFIVCDVRSPHQERFLHEVFASVGASAYLQMRLFEWDDDDFS